MATTKTRQRKLARAKFDRQQARRAERERRGRQIRASIAGVIAITIATLGGLWIGGVFDKEPAPLPAADDCAFSTLDIAANTSLRDEGLPAKTGVPSTGTAKMTVAMQSNSQNGNVTVELNRSTAKCATAALTYLANKNYYGNTKCHKLDTTDGALSCGDHSETGNGGAGFTWYPENFPTEPLVPPTPTADPSASPVPTAAATPTPAPSPPVIRYKRGDVVMLPSTNGSQFIIFYKDSTASINYSIVGKVTDGLAFIDQVATAGNAEGGTKPKNDVVIQSLTVVGNDALPSATPAASQPPTPQPTPSATPSS